MSLPERLFRIAKHKIGEIKDHIDHIGEDAELDPDVVEKRRRAQSRRDAREELDDTMSDSEIRDASRSPVVDAAGSPIKGARRTPDQISRGARSAQSSSQSASGSQTLPESDPLEMQYRQLGVEIGSDLSVVQAAYEKKIARLNGLASAPVGSEDARQAQALRDRFDTAYHTLKEALDPTARRFDLLEI